MLHASDVGYTIDYRLIIMIIRRTALRGFTSGGSRSGSWCVYLRQRPEAAAAKLAPMAGVAAALRFRIWSVVLLRESAKMHAKSPSYR